MLLQCPSCSARYQIAAEAWPADETARGDLLLRARKVRCRRCQEVWLATPQEEEEIFDPGPPLDAGPVRAVPVSAASVPAPVPAAFARQGRVIAEAALEEEEVPPKRRRLWPWLVVAGAVAAGLYGAVAGDLVDPEAYGLPPLAGWAKPELASVRLPEMPGIALPQLSLPVVTVPAAPAPQLALAADVRKDPIPGGGAVWTVTGTISNFTPGRLPLPPIELELVGADNAVLSSWSIRPPAETLGPGKAIPFETTALNPPPDAARVRVMLKPASLARL